jgi:hypothetical protein
VVTVDVCAAAGNAGATQAKTSAAHGHTENFMNLAPQPYAMWRKPLR